MARSKTDLPRMQNPARSRVPLDHGLNIATQVLDRPDKSEGEEKPKQGRLMRQYDLVERVRRYNPHTDEDLLNRAYVYAMKAHGEQKRASGDPYFSHPLEVAAILTDLKLDDATIAAALLHDTIEDTPTTRAEIDQIFGPDIGHLVEGLTKLKRLDLVSREAKQAENLRKLLLAIADDVRVLLVKLADRLHNMRTLQHMPPEGRKRIAQETLDIYAPLAGRMGMHGLREELEDLSFRELNPEAYEVVADRLREISERSVGLISEIEQQLTRKLAESGIVASVLGRRKRPYSVWRKMERKSVGFEQLSDIFGFRVVVNTPEECYHALGIVHTTWPMVPTRFKDYISTPKQNDYRSIHTTVIGPGKQRVELQIRTEEMHQIAEYGIAAHALYKDSAGSPSELLSRESNAYAWLRRTVELLAEGSNPEEFLEHTKLELFHDQVFCFTPKGKLIALPRLATAIDFAYAVHTDVGNHAVGCKINGKIAPLVSELNNGDEVEVLTSKAQIAPPVAWESIVLTGKARLAIRRATRNAVRAQYAELGRRIVERLCQRAEEAVKGHYNIIILSDRMVGPDRIPIPALLATAASAQDLALVGRTASLAQSRAALLASFADLRADGVTLLRFEVPDMLPVPEGDDAVHPAADLTAPLRAIWETGLTTAGLRFTAGETVQPRSTRVIDLRLGLEAVRAAWHPTRRRYARQAEESGVRVRLASATEAASLMVERAAALYESGQPCGKASLADLITGCD